MFLAVVAGSVGLAACGGSDADEPAVGATEAEPVVRVEPTDDDPAAAAEREPSAAAAPPDQDSALDPLQLAPGTALVRIDGRDLRFTRGDSIFDLCDTLPVQQFAEVEMELADGPEEGAPHFVLRFDENEQVMVVAFLPDTGFVVGRGEETDPYVSTFGIVPPLLDMAVVTLTDDTISGTTPMVNVFTEEEARADFAVRCR